jgi:hypothetical protein
MASQAKLGKGTKLYRGGTTSPETYNLIEEVLEIDGTPGGIPDIISVYNHDSPDLYDEVITGKINLAEIQIRCNYINSTQQNLVKDDMESGTLRYYKITVPAVSATKTIIFAARVRGWRIITPTNEQQRLEMALQPSGAPIFT